MWTTPTASRVGKYVDHETVRVLDVAAGGGPLLADSRVVWSLTEPAEPADHPRSCLFGAGVLVAADGKSIVCQTATFPTGPYHRGQHVTIRWLAYSTAAPTVARVLATITVPQSSPGILAVTAEPVSAARRSSPSGTCSRTTTRPRMSMLAWSVRAPSGRCR